MKTLHKELSYGNKVSKQIAIRWLSLRDRQIYTFIAVDP